MVSTDRDTVSTEPNRISTPQDVDQKVRDTEEVVTKKKKKNKGKKTLRGGEAGETVGQTAGGGAVDR